MKKIALVLVCYNKKDDVIKCIESIFNSTIGNYDIIFIDNASTDNSAEAVREKFGADNRLKIIVNDTNNGAGAGFNDGLRHAISNGCDYAMTLDHDIILDRNAIEILYNFLEGSAETGAAFSKFCYMDTPDIIQFSTGNFDWELFSITSPYTNALDSSDIPEIIFCDCFISGAVMFKVDVLKKCGLYNEDYFIYGEDDELGLRLNAMGYKVAFCSKSRVLHKRHQLEYAKQTTMATYYNRRNRISMIVRYVEEKDVERYCRHLASDLFMLIYSCAYQNKTSTLTTAVFACDDALNNIMGKAKPGRILEADIVRDRFAPLLKDAKRVLIMALDEFAYKKKCVKNLVDKIKSNTVSEITIVTNDVSLPIDYDKTNIVRQADSIDTSSFDVCFHTCAHIFKVADFKDGFAYVDEYTNIAITAEDKKYCADFENRLALFMSYMYPLFLDKIKTRRAEYGKL